MLFVGLMGIGLFLPGKTDAAGDAESWAIQQAAEIQKEANKAINEYLVDDRLMKNILSKDEPKKGCPSQLPEGKLVPAKAGKEKGQGQQQNQSKGCFKNKTPSTPQHTSQNDTSSLQKEKGNQNIVPAKAGILVFVSFSMPEASLKSLAQEAQRVSTQRDASQQPHAVLVMRGLYQDSFVKTASKLQELGIAVDIHPELFDTHHVTSVPTFVQLEDGQPIHSLKGNVTLDFVMKTFKDQKVEEAP